MSNRSTTRRCDWFEVPPSVAVVETIADVDDTEIGSSPPLAHDAEVDALDELLRGTATADPDGVVVSPRYHEYDVAISSFEWIEVER